MKSDYVILDSPLHPVGAQVVKNPSTGAGDSDSIPRLGTSFLWNSLHCNLHDPIMSLSMKGTSLIPFLHPFTPHYNDLTELKYL